MFNALYRELAGNNLGSNISAFSFLKEKLNFQDSKRLTKYATYWNFFHGYHWQEIAETDGPEYTENWCKAFVNKFVGAECKNPFVIKMNKKAEEKVLPFIYDVWSDNDGDRVFFEIAQGKSVSGDAYLHVLYQPPGESAVNPITGEIEKLEDPFGLYPKGRIRLIPIPSSICFPHFQEGYDTYAMDYIDVVYPIAKKRERSVRNILARDDGVSFDLLVYRYMKTELQIFKNGELLHISPNPYGIIPIVHFKNISLNGAQFGISDLTDVIGMNVELNLKKTDISEIIDYHAAPLTAVFGAKLSQLEKGANKIYGGLPKDARIENVELKSDMTLNTHFTEGILDGMLKIGGVPEISFGKDIPTNVSGVAMDLAFTPLLDILKFKNVNNKPALKQVNRLIVKIALTHNLLEQEDLTNQELYNMEINCGEVLPKDALMELQAIREEIKLKLETRAGAMKRLKKDNVEQILKEVDEDAKKCPNIYGEDTAIISKNQKLVNALTGKVIAENIIEVPEAMKNEEILNEEASVPRATNTNRRPIHQNAKGGEKNINSGVLNKNPGKKIKK